MVKRHTRPSQVAGAQSQSQIGGVIERENPHPRLQRDAARRQGQTHARSHRARGRQALPRRQEHAERGSTDGHRDRDAPPARLKIRYLEEIRPALIERFGYSSVMQAPKLEKITLNMGVGLAKQDSKMLKAATEQLATIAGQQPSVRRARKSIAAFKLREGMPVGVAVTLRGERGYEFLDRLVSIAIPRIRDFRGLSARSFDGRGNYSMGVKEQIIFPEIDYDAIDQVRGLDITITTSRRPTSRRTRCSPRFGHAVLPRGPPQGLRPRGRRGRRARARKKPRPRALLLRRPPPKRRRHRPQRKQKKAAAAEQAAAETEAEAETGRARSEEPQAEEPQAEQEPQAERGRRPSRGVEYALRPRRRRAARPQPSSPGPRPSRPPSRRAATDGQDFPARQAGAPAEVQDTCLYSLHALRQAARGVPASSGCAASAYASSPTTVRSPG